MSAQADNDGFIVNVDSAGPGTPVIRLLLDAYADRTAALVAHIWEGMPGSEDGYWAPYTKLSVNLSREGLTLAPWQVAVKSFDEHETFAKLLMATGVFADTGRRANGPYCQWPIWQLRPERLQADTVLLAQQRFSWQINAGQLLEGMTRECILGGWVDPIINLDGYSVSLKIVDDELSVRALGHDGISSRELTATERSDFDVTLAAGDFTLTAGVGDGGETVRLVEGRDSSSSPIRWMRHFLGPDVVAQRPVRAVRERTPSA